MKNKILPYVIYGVPIAIGVYFIYKYFKSKSDKKVEEPKIEPTSTETPTSIPVTNVTKYEKKDTLPFKKGIESVYVGVIQRKLGIKDDNKFGNDTYNAVVKFQKQKKIKVDGVVGKDTWKALFGQDFPNTGSFDTPTQTQTSTQTPRQNYVTLPPKETPIAKPTVFDPFNIVKK